MKEYCTVPYGTLWCSSIQKSPKGIILTALKWKIFFRGCTFEDARDPVAIPSSNIARRTRNYKLDRGYYIIQKLINMVASFSCFAICCAVLLCSVQAFSPTNVASRVSVRGSTIVMDGKTRDLRDRIKSIKNTRRITEAMRLVAAARVRRAQEAVLKTRPLISQLQLVILSFHHFIIRLLGTKIKRECLTVSFCLVGVQNSIRCLQERGSWITHPWGPWGEESVVGSHHRW